MSQYTISKIELPNGDECTFKVEEYERKIDALMDIIDEFAKTRTIWRGIEDSAGNPILDSSGNPVEGRVIFSRL